MSDAAIILGIIVAVIGFVGAITSAVVATRQKGLTDLVTALQIELEATREEVRGNDTRIRRLESRDRAWANYVHRLRAHITAQLPPPPPEWPAGLDI